MENIILNGLKHLASIASGFGKKKHLFILIYHRVLDEPDFMRSGEVDKKVFSWQMQLLQKYFNVLQLADALEKMGNNTLPPRAVCITFDDGYADNYLNALPILKQNQLPATFFIASGYLNGGRMWNDTIIETIRRYRKEQLNLEKIQLGIYKTTTEAEKEQAANQIILKIKYLGPEIRAEYTNYIASFTENLPDNLMLNNQQLLQLERSGMEIGGHTVTHPIMSKTPAKQLIKEIRNNKQTLESLINKPLRFFAYPNGKPSEDYLPSQVRLIMDNGYQAAVSTQWGVSNNESDLFQLPRFTPWDKQPVKFMLRMIQKYFSV